MPNDTLSLRVFAPYFRENVGSVDYQKIRAIKKYFLKILLNIFSNET